MPSYQNDSQFSSTVYHAVNTKSIDQQNFCSTEAPVSLVRAGDFLLYSVFRLREKPGFFRLFRVVFRVASGDFLLFFFLGTFLRSFICDNDY